MIRGDATVAPDGHALRRIDLLVIVTLVIVGAALRFYRIGTALWYDEIVTLVESVRQPLSEIVTRFPGDNHHPLYSVLAHLAVGAFGEQPWALRLPAALCGVASIPLLYLVGRRVTGRMEAAAASLILTVSYHHVWFSQNARGYTAVLLAVLLSTYALLRWLDGRNRSFIMVFAVSTALGAYAHLTTVLVAVGQALALVIGWMVGDRSGKSSTAWKDATTAFLAAAGLTVLIYAPMLGDVGAVMSSGESSGGDTATLAWTIAAVLQGLQVGFGALAAIVLGGAIVGAGLVSYFRQRPLIALLFILPIIVTVGAALVLDRPVRPRFMFFGVGFALLFIVRGAANIGAIVGAALGGSPRTAATAGVALVTIGAVALSVRSLPYGYRYPKQDYVQAVTFVERSMHPGDVAVVIGDGAEIPVVRYLGRQWPRVSSAEELRALTRGGGNAWVVSTFPSYIRSGRPELWRFLESDCTTMADIEGTVEDGAITVRRCS
jgi:hypothetical protein